MPLTPSNREEHWLQGMVDGETTLTPNNRREHWYEEIINASGGGGGGTGGGVLKISVTVQAGGTQAVMDKTWAEINEAAFSVVVASFAEGENSWMPVVGTVADGEHYNVTVAFPQNEDGLITFSEMNFFTISETGYPGMPLS